MKLLFVIFFLFLTTTKVALSQKANAGRDTAIKKGQQVTIGGTGDPSWCYFWAPATGLNDPKILNPVAKPTAKTKYKLTVTGVDFTFKESDEMEVLVLDTVKFKENSTQKYGFDDGAYTGPAAGVVAKSVEAGKNDPVDLEIVPADGANGVYMKSGNEGFVKVSPLNPTASPQTLSLSGVASGQTIVEANCGSVSGTKLGELKTGSYTMVTKTLAIRLVHEENDDVQVIPVGKGRSNQVAILAGLNDSINTVPAGDDVKVGKTITTGPDGICQTTASGDDVQSIAVGKGKANEIGVGKGNNNFRDTRAAVGDDVIAGNDIDTGPDGICQTTALSTNVMSADFSDATVLAYLNNQVYNQAVCKWTIVRLPAKTINMDLNRDGKIDVSDLNEQRVIVDSCKDDSYDKNIFYLNNAYVSSASIAVYGYMPFNQRYGYVDVGAHSGAATVENTMAHELGHGGFGLRHPTNSACGAVDPSSNYDDPRNVMDYCNDLKLRKFQWDIINP